MGDSKYITEMKELSPEAPTGQSDVSNDEGFAKVNQYRKRVTEPASKNEDSVKDIKPDTETDVKELAIGEDKPYTSKDIILGVINFLCVGVIIFLIIKFPDKAAELKNEHNKTILNDSSFSYELSEVKAAKNKANEIAELFVDDSGVADFLNELEKIKADSGLITKISFGNQNAVNDKATGLLGIPVIIEFSGDVDLILNDIKKIQSLPFILRSITVDISRSESDPNVVSLKYGALLYVDDSI